MVSDYAMFSPMNERRADRVNGEEHVPIGHFMNGFYVYENTSVNTKMVTHFTRNGIEHTITFHFSGGSTCVVQYPEHMNVFLEYLWISKRWQDQRDRKVRS